MTATVRPRPCSTCPYRLDAPSGVWSADEYDKLPSYDGDIGDQVAAGAFVEFCCHSAPDRVCAGWAGHRDPRDLLAVRLGISRKRLDLSVVDCADSVVV